MTTFVQWNRSRPLRQVAWVCGPEPVLRRQVVAEYITRLSSFQKSTWWFGAHEEGHIWDYLLASPDSGRLVIVQAADQSRLADRFDLLVRTLPPLSYVVFVSPEDDFTRIPVKSGKRAETQLAPHLAAVRASKEGQLIRCCRPSRDEELLKLVASWWPEAGANWAQEVWERCGGDLTATWQACDTARRAGLAPGIAEHLDMACQQAPGSGFAELLLAGKTPQALEEAHVLGPQEALSAIGQLNSCLAQVRSYAAWAARGLGPDEIAKRGISRYRQRLLAPHAGRYSPARELRCRRLLALAEDSLRSGATSGVMEAVASLW